MQDIRIEDPSDDDPALARFLASLALDIERDPWRLRPVDAEFAARLRRLVEDVEVDLEAPLADEEA